MWGKDSWTPGSRCAKQRGDPVDTEESKADPARREGYR